MKTWIYHLVYCEVKPESWPAESFLLCKDKSQVFSKPAHPGMILENLLKLFRQGLTEPIHFFPETSFEYVQQILKKKDNQQYALIKAKNKWQGSDFNRGEIEDPYYQRCFNNLDPMDESFEDIAKRIYLPILEHHTEIAI